MKEVVPKLEQDDFSLFYQVASSVHPVLEPDVMLRKLLSIIKQSFGLEGASLAIHDPSNQEFYFLRSIEDAKSGKRSSSELLRFPDHVGVAGWVLQEKRTVIIPDAGKDERVYRGLDSENNFKVKSMICLPLQTRKGLLGVLYALNKLHGEFSEKDAKLLELLSGWISVSLENAEMYGQLRRYASTLEKENRELRSKLADHFNLQGIVGSSKKMEQVFSLLDKVIDTETSVLIQGETGTGKELIARAIHYNGPLKDKPFIAENCGALPDSLLESELFGHVKGAFTGAISSKKGLFELADGGTIFLDEIGEMPLSMQVKLLRVLQEGQMRPVGSTRYVDVKVRLIASTNRDLEEEVTKGNFRQDLLFRINVFPITMPPLREREDDIHLLVQHFLQKYAAKMGRPPVQISPGAQELLSRFHWPGNIRELENEIERALTLAGYENSIGIEHLSAKLKPSEPDDLIAEMSGNTLKEIVENVEKRLVVKTLQQTNGNQTKAAQKLGLTRQGIANKIARYGIDK